MDNRFSVDDVIGIVRGADGDWDDGIEAYVSVRSTEDRPEVVEVELEAHDGMAERFRVTVERIE